MQTKNYESKGNINGSEYHYYLSIDVSADNNINEWRFYCLHTNIENNPEYLLKHLLKLPLLEEFKEDFENIEFINTEHSDIFSGILYKPTNQIIGYDVDFSSGYYKFICEYDEVTLKKPINEIWFTGVDHNIDIVDEVETFEYEDIARKYMIKITKDYSNKVVDFRYQVQDKFAPHDIHISGVCFSDFIDNITSLDKNKTFESVHVRDSNYHVILYKPTNQLLGWRSNEKDMSKIIADAKPEVSFNVSGVKEIGK